MKDICTRGERNNLQKAFFSKKEYFGRIYKKHKTNRLENI